MPTPTTLPAAFTTGQILTSTAMNNLRGAFRVLQVVSTAKTDTFSTTSTSFVDVTGLSVSITPSFTSSRILILGYINIGISGDIAYNGRLMRDSTAIFVGDAASLRPRDTFYNGPGLAFTSAFFAYSPVFLDSPNTTSATTYKFQMNVSSGTGYVNRTHLDRDNASFDGRTASSITVLEISA